jgi:2-dehydro-3-deoxyphosphooctonate aldolase (KDO 8-P synthase)
VDLLVLHIKFDPMIHKLLPNIKHTESGNFFLIAGPCVVENTSTPFEIAEKLQQICKRLEIPFIFKASYRKANRSKQSSFTGIGNEKALKLIQKVGKEFSIPTITDIHTEAEAYTAAKYVDALQIPAFLSRQTDLLIAAAKTGKLVNIKKGQFMSPQSMMFAIHKVRNAGNANVLCTDRGTMFGYQDLIVDFRSVPIMKKFGSPVVVDCTHSLQQPNQEKGVTGGQPEMIETIARASIAVGADGLFIETHPKPEIALSDGANMLRLEYMEGAIGTPYQNQKSYYMKLAISLILSLVFAHSFAQNSFKMVFSSTGYDEGIRAFRTSSGEYRIVGNTAAYGQGGNEVWVIALDSSASFMWQKTYGTNQNDEAVDAYQSANGDIWITGNVTETNPPTMNVFCSAH